MEFATAKYQFNGNEKVAVATHGSDASVWAEFYMKPIKMEHESVQQGRPIFKEIPYILITFPGDRTKNWDQPVKMISDMNGPSDPERFPRQWQAFKNQQEQVPDGTPINEFPALGRARVMELKAMNIHTVEQYAAVQDGMIESLGLGARVERDKCQAYLSKAVNMSQISALQDENQTLKADVQMLQQQIKELASRMRSSEDETQPAVRRGRPPTKIQGE